MKNIILIAPPAAGKGTQATLISEKYNIPHISIGDLIRASISDEDIKDKLREGLLLDDDLICCLLERRISKDDCKDGFILDGFPRNVNQAINYSYLLKKLNKVLGLVIVIEMNRDEGVRRMLGRLVCSNCGAGYNETEPSMIPKKQGICDVCGSILEKRSDDNVETFMKRFDIYNDETEKVIKYYEETHKVHFIESINIETTFKEIDAIIRKEG